MEEFASNFLNTVEEGATPEGDDRDDEGQQDTGSAKKSRTGLRHGFFRAANLQDKLLEKLISQVIPADDGHAPDLTASDIPAYAERPGFSVAGMAVNFRRFNARIGVVFKFQARALRPLAWRRPTQTLSFLAVYTFVCLDPYLLLALPLAIAIFGILVPSFIARHPAPIADSDRVRNMAYSPRGPPLAPARTVKPVKEVSRDFLRNMGDLQNVMEDFSVAHDAVVALVLPKTNFSDEALSSALFVLLSAACLLMLIAGHLLPLRFIALTGGWAAVCSNHPAIARWLHHHPHPPSSPNHPYNHHHPSPSSPESRQATTPIQTRLTTLLTSDITLDPHPPTREVEIFELQHLPSSSSPHTEWTPWLFSPSPYDPLSASRIAGARPRGTRFFEDVLPPRGWEWSEKKWALDLWSREWVEERIITGVEVETEGERWVYDLVVDGGNGGSGGNGEGMGMGGEEEGEGWWWGELGGRGEGVGRRGQWRRRRWVRMVKRQKVVPKET